MEHQEIALGQVTYEIQRVYHGNRRQNGVTLVREFADAGWSGGPLQLAFQEMMRWLEQGKANTVITKDLSRLGRDMREASYYAEQFCPEQGIRCIAIGDNKPPMLSAFFPFDRQTNKNRQRPGGYSSGRPGNDMCGCSIQDRSNR